MVFTVVAQTVYYVLDRLVPDIRSFVTEKWIQLRKENLDIVPSLPGGALALKSTTILEEIENYGIMKMTPIIEDLCHIIPEVGINLGVQGTIPFDDWCKVGVVELMRDAIRTVGVRVHFLVNERALMSTAPVAAAFLSTILTTPIGDIVTYVKENRDRLMEQVTTTVENAIMLAEVSNDLTKSLKKRVQVASSATCEIGDVICDADKIVMMSSVLVDKNLIWESIVNRLDNPMLKVFGGLNDFVHKADKAVERRLTSPLSRHHNSPSTSRLSNNNHNHNFGGGGDGGGGLHAGFSP